MRRRLPIILLLISAVLLLAGCGEVDQPITAESTGIWNRFFVFPLSQVIVFFAKIMGDSYGWAIILVTIVVRLLLVPLNVRQIRSSKAMQDVQPKMVELQKKYSSKDQATQQKLQEETMELFQKHGVNPLAGCLPIFVQMPILIAMYHSIMRTEAIGSEQFLWFALASPDYVLPIIAGIATFVQQRITMSINAGTSQASQATPQQQAQQQQMKIMLYMMPIMITVMGFVLPAALTLYWVVGNIFMVIQTLLINRPMMMKTSNGGETK